MERVWDCGSSPQGHSEWAIWEESRRALEGISKKKRTELMQKTAVFVVQTNALVHTNGVENVFLEAILVSPEITRTFASGKWTFLLSSPAQSNHPTITQRIKQLSSNKQPWNIMFHALISVKISVKMGLKSVFHGNCSTECAPFSLSSPSPSFIYR